MKSKAQHCLYSGSRDVAGQRIAVLGMARTGAAAVRFLASRGADVFALDLRPEADWPDDSRAAGRLARRIVAPYQSIDDLLPLDALVISPGVPTEAPIVQAAREAGAEIIGEVELAYRFSQAPMIAVTGTCGKGTTVTSLGAMLHAAGAPHVVAGNIGSPLIDYAEGSVCLDCIVAEISSFQLETTTHFHPWISILLNITEDHLERYADFEAYVQAKRLIFRNQTAKDWAILCMDDPQVREIGGKLSGPKVLTVCLDDPSANARVDGDALVVQLPGAGPETLAHRGDIQLPGEHHLINTLAAALAARIMGVPPDRFPEAVRGYRPAPHLMALVADCGGVRYIDDSKATNPASAIADLLSIEGPAIVIAGGKEKDTDFAEYGAVLAQKAKHVFVMGECAQRIMDAVGDPSRCTVVTSMDEAVARAIAVAEAGDTVTLCPACSSLDMFASYAARGDAFARAVRERVG